VDIVKGLFRGFIVVFCFLVLTFQPISQLEANSVVPEGVRALTIRVSEENAEAVRVGQAVDVMAQHQPSRKNRLTATQVLLRNVLVLAAGGSLSNPENPAKTVTLLVTPQQVEVLIMSPPQTRFRLSPTSPVFLPPKNSYDPQNSCLMRQVEWRERWIEIYHFQITVTRTKCKYPILDPFSLAHP
jgi:hypothetical protein